MSQVVKEGDKVKLHYTGKLKDGTEFDSSKSREPFEFTIGGGQVIPGLEQAMIGKAAGENFTVEIPCEQAYGQRSDELVQQIERKYFAADQEIEVGQQFVIGQNDYQTIVTIIDIKPGDTPEAAMVVVDANHPLASKDLVFDIELLEIIG